MKSGKHVKRFNERNVWKQVLCIAVTIAMITFMIPKMSFAKNTTELTQKQLEETSEIEAAAIEQSENINNVNEAQTDTSIKDESTTEYVNSNEAALYYGIVDNKLYISANSTTEATEDGTKALNATSISAIPWNSNAKTIKEVIIQGKSGDIVPTGFGYWFYNMEICKNIQNLKYIDTSKATTLNSLFYGCRALESIDLSNFNTSAVTNMSKTFAGCTSVRDLDTSKFDTSNVTLMPGMFEGNLKIQKRDLRNFNTSKVTDMSRMFDENNVLREINLDCLDTSNVTTMKEMFNSCITLKNVYINNFNTSNLTTTANMFYNCHSLENLDLHLWNTSNVTTFEHMFGSCKSLKSLNISGWNTTNATSLLCMFCECQSLEYIDLTHFITKNVTNMNRVFDSCTSLKSVNVSTWDTSSATSMSGMFQSCTSLESLDIKNFNTKNVESMSAMFKGCTGMTTIDLSTFETNKLWNLASMFEGCTNVETIDIGKAILFKLEGKDTSMVSTFKNCVNLKTVYANALFSEDQKWDKPAFNKETFLGCKNIIGAEDTVYSENHIDATYARIDKASIGKPGYFTTKITEEITIEFNIPEAGFIVNDKGDIVKKLDLFENCMLEINENILTITPPNKNFFNLFGSSLVTENYFAVANDGYIFKSWEISSTVVDENTTIKVNFEKVTDNPEIENIESAYAQTGDTYASWIWTLAIIIIAGTGSILARRYRINK